MVHPELSWVKEAKQHIGMHEIRQSFILNDWIKELNVQWLGKNPAWCGIFVAKVFKNVGMKYPVDFYRAASYRTFGTQLARPAYGCVAIKTRKGGNHVTFVIGENLQGQLCCLGGNQDDRVKISVYDKNDFDTFVWIGKTSKPADHRYTLPILNATTGAIIKES